MKNVFFLITLITSLLASWSCGGSDNQDVAVYEVNVEVEPIDSPAYKLGRSHAEAMLFECRTETEIRDRLLDLRAREHIIRTQTSPSSADAYIEGIESYIRESGDSLGNAIL